MTDFKLPYLITGSTAFLRILVLAGMYGFSILSCLNNSEDEKVTSPPEIKILSIISETEKELTIAWQSPKAYENFQLKYTTDTLVPFDSWEHIPHLSFSMSTFQETLYHTLINLENGVTYYFRISAEIDGNTNFGATYTGVPQINPTDSLRVISKNGAAVVDWFDGREGASFTLRKIDVNNNDTSVFNEVISPFKDSMLVNMQEYAYFLTTKIGPSESRPSGTVTTIPTPFSEWAKISDATLPTGRFADYIFVAGKTYKIEYEKDDIFLFQSSTDLINWTAGILPPEFYENSRMTMWNELTALVQIEKTGSGLNPGPSNIRLFTSSDMAIWDTAAVWRALPIKIIQKAVAVGSYLLLLSYEHICITDMNLADLVCSEHSRGNVSYNTEYIVRGDSILMFDHSSKTDCYQATTNFLTWSNQTYLKIDIKRHRTWSPLAFPYGTPYPATLFVSDGIMWSFSNIYFGRLYFSKNGKNWTRIFIDPLNELANDPLSLVFRRGDSIPLVVFGEGKSSNAPGGIWKPKL